MRRLAWDPRPDWDATVRSQGLVFIDTELPGGRVMSYWDESACYRLDLDEVLRLEAVTEELHRMCLVAAEHVVHTGRYRDFGIPEWAADAVAASLANKPPSLYGRFDLCYDGVGPAKLLEYNADTPTGLVEAAIVQWYWLEDTRPDHDQWNSLHESLVAQWRRIAPRLADGTVHLSWTSADTSGEDLMTVGYLAETAHQAGLKPTLIEIGDIGYDGRRFVDLDIRPITTCFKLYPWETMLDEPFGRTGLDPKVPITWIEPAWKLLLSNKALLAVLWELFPDHENLLPAYLDGPRDMTEYAAKPLFGREGASIRLHTRAGVQAQDGDYGDEGYCYQQFWPLPEFDGNRLVLGSWMVGDEACGVGLRETKGLVTDGYARFLPHFVDAPRPPAPSPAPATPETPTSETQS